MKRDPPSVTRSNNQLMTSPLRGMAFIRLIKNIVRDVVPNDELMDAQFKLAAALLAKADQAAKE